MTGEEWLQLFTHNAREPEKAWCSGCHGRQDVHVMVAKVPERPGYIQVYCMANQKPERDILRLVRNALFVKGQTVDLATDKDLGKFRPGIYMTFKVPA